MQGLNRPPALDIIRLNVAPFGATGEAIPLPELPLPPHASAQLRDRLLRELNDLGDADDAALWAHRSLPQKNKLAAGGTVMRVSVQGVLQFGQRSEAFSFREGRVMSVYATPLAKRVNSPGTNFFWSN